MLIPYKGQYVMLYECGWYHPDGTGRYGRYSADIRLAHSRDGERFQRINPEQIVIPRGAPGDWDGQFLVISDKAVIAGDRILLYYCGQGKDWASWPPGNAVENLLISPGSTSVSSTGLATLRLDGFTCLEVADRISFGAVTTRALTPSAPSPLGLEVNIGSVRAGTDWLQVEVLDAGNGRPLDGFARTDCAPIITDGLHVPVRWRGGDLSRATRRPFRLRFHLFGRARLYAFRLSGREGGGA